MSIQTATVEALTAEVRVLMVGSRQVTLSVAKQLDRLHMNYADGFTPMGRVRTGLKVSRYSGWDDRTFRGDPAHEFIGEFDGRLVLLVVSEYGDLTREQIAACQKWQNELPLIVLAGLK